MISRRWGPAAVWAAFILVLTSVPNPSIPDVRGGDKLVHFSLYAIFALLALRGVRARPAPRWAWLWVLVGISLFGAIDELHQLVIPGRSAEVADWLADTAGDAAGVLLGAFLLRRDARERTSYTESHDV